MKNKLLIAQELRVRKELAKLVNLSKEYFPGIVTKVDENAMAFFVVAVQPPTEQRSALLSAHVISPATLSTPEYNTLKIYDLVNFGFPSVMTSLLADEFGKRAEKLIEVAQQVLNIHAEGGHA